MSMEALVSPWRTAFILPGGSEPLSPRTLLIQGLEDLGSSSALEAKVGASSPNDWREILRELHPFKYEDMTISLDSPGMPSRNAAGWLSPVVIDPDSMAETQNQHHVKLPVSMVSSRPIGSQPFMLGPVPRSPARRTKLRSDEEQEVADILVMLRSRATQPRMTPLAEYNSDSNDDSLPTSTPNSPANVSFSNASNALSRSQLSQAHDLALPRLYSDRDAETNSIQHNDTELIDTEPSDAAPSDAEPSDAEPSDAEPSDAESNGVDRNDADQNNAEYNDAKYNDADYNDAESDLSSELAIDVKLGSVSQSAVEVKHTQRTKLVRDIDWKPHMRSDVRPRGRSRSKRVVQEEDIANGQTLGGARSVDQSNELEKMLRDIGFMAIRTERTSISCSLCQQRFPSRMFAVRHAQRDHLGVKPFECNICHMRFVRLDSVPRHIKNVHQRKTTKRKKKRSNKS